MNKHIELPALEAALRRAFSLGQIYWQQADSEYSSQHKKADETLAKFKALIPETLSAIAAHEQALVVGEPVAWVRRHPDGALTAEFLEDAVIEPARKQSGAWVPLGVLASLPAPQEAQAELSEAAKDAIGRWLEADMHMAVMNGANSVSMPDELVEIAGWLFEATAAPVAQPATEQAEAPSDAAPLTPEQEEWVMDLAEKHNLGRCVPQICAMRGVAPDVFYTDASYRTHELFCFAAALLSTKEPT